MSQPRESITLTVPISSWQEILPALECLYELRACAFLNPGEPYSREMKPGGPFAFQVRDLNGNVTDKVMFCIVEYPNDL